MRKHFYRYITGMLLAMTLMIGSIQTFAAEFHFPVETITLDETFSQAYIVPTDISWKTKQDKGQWIEDLGIAEDAKSLILVLNNLDKEEPDTIFTASIESWNNKQGKSRLFYFSKGTEGEWDETFSVECYISGGRYLDKEDIYGVYEPVSSFGELVNPGSLLSYKTLTVNDYWTADPEDENYGSIYTAEESYEAPGHAINLSTLKGHSNYGMILHPQDDTSVCPPLVINCQQPNGSSDVLPGFCMPQEYLRMMIQSIDKETKVYIIENLANLEQI